MFLTVHAAAGLSVATFTGNPFIAFVLGFFSHFLIDMIPHGDEKIDAFTNRWTRKHRIAALAVIDIVIAAVPFFLFLKPLILANPAVSLMGALGGMMPDFIQGLAMFKKHKLLTLYERWHRWAHTLLKQEIPFRYGIIVQLSFLTLLLYPLVTEKFIF